MRKIHGVVRRIGLSLVRILGLLAILLGVPVAAYWLWSPGADFSCSTLDRRENAIWIGHGWLGDDAWFKRNRRNMADFRTDAKIRELMTMLRDNHIKFVYPHLCPAQYDGQIAAYDAEQTQRFLALADEYDIVVIPWVGGVYGESARPQDRLWRENFIASIARFMEEHPQIGGVQINIEPMPSGNQAFLTLLEEIRPVLGDRILGVAAYPPPTFWQPVPEVHWELSYLGEVGKRSDQMAVMMYDTAIRLDKFYIQLMRDWTSELNRTVADTECKLLLGIPSYEDAGVGYHDPGVENMGNALNGIQSAQIGTNYLGVALYCEWEMTPEKWSVWNKFLQK